MKDALWTVRIDVDTLTEIQHKLVSTLDNYAILSHVTGISADGGESAAYKAAATGADHSDAASVATAATSTQELLKGI